MKSLTLLVLLVLGVVLTGCGVSGTAEGSVAGKTGGSANVASPIK